MKKKVFIKCYLEKNLGDDLFLKLITDRYSNIFYTYSCKKYDNKLFSNNLKITYINNFFYRLICKICNLLKIGNIFDIYFAKKSDLVTIVGGSIFIEEKKSELSDILYYKRLKKPYYILGANIGPFHTIKYLKNVNKILNLSNDSCLRDKASYNLFENKKNIRVKPDIIFSFNCSRYKTVTSIKVIISLINLEKKKKQIDLVNYEDYYNKILELSKKFINMGYELCFMSFCDEEGDFEAIQKIVLNLNDFKEKFYVYSYNGNIDEALQIFADSSIVVGSRFHANILGLIMNKTIIPIIYNDKTENMLKDINFKGLKIRLKDIKDFNVDNLNYKSISYKIDISKQIRASKKQFEKLDKILILNNGVDIDE